MVRNGGWSLAGLVGVSRNFSRVSSGRCAIGEGGERAVRGVARGGMPNENTVRCAGLRDRGSWASLRGRDGTGRVWVVSEWDGEELKVE